MTIWPFQNVVCFTAPDTKCYVAPRLSAAYCLYILGWACLILVPLFTTFATANVWMKESSYREQPLFRSAHDLLVIFAGDSPSDSTGWAVREDLYNLLPARIQVPSVATSSLDYNHDGLADRVSVKLEIPLNGSSTMGYRYMLLLAVFHFELREAQASMLGLATVEVNAPYSATGVWVQGQVKLRQRLPLRADSGAWGDLLPSPLEVDWSSSWSAENHPISLKALLERYASRNSTMYLEQTSPPVWDYAPRDTFQAEVVLDVPPQPVYYVPGVLEVLKFAWMQVASFILPVWIVVHAVKSFAFESQLVESSVVTATVKDSS